MSVKLKDIAQKAGVSISTVSKSLNNSQEVKDETKKRIKKIAEELNYVPFGPGRSLKNGKTNIIAVIVPFINNIYFSSITQTVKNSLKEHGYFIMLGSTNSKYEEEKRYVSLINSGQVDGAIFIADFNEELNAQLYENKPLVNIGLVNNKNLQIPSVKTNVKENTYKLVKYLYKKGCIKIGFAGNDERKYEGYKKALIDFNIFKNIGKFKYENEDTFEKGKEIGEEIINLSDAERPEALICSNDELAVGVINFFNNNNLNIKDYLAITGFDNIRMSQVCNPSLTTVEIPRKKMAKKSVKLLLDLIENKFISKEDRIFTYPSKIIRRESTEL